MRGVNTGIKEACARCGMLGCVVSEGRQVGVGRCGGEPNAVVPITLATARRPLVRWSVWNDPIVDLVSCATTCWIGADLCGDPEIRR